MIKTGFISYCLHFMWNSVHLGNLSRSTLTLNADSNRFKMFVINSNSPLLVSMYSHLWELLLSLGADSGLSLGDQDFCIRHWIRNMSLIQLYPIGIFKERQWGHPNRLLFLIARREWGVYFNSHCRFGGKAWASWLNFATYMKANWFSIECFTA